jgi:hypothetical protein
MILRTFLSVTKIKAQKPLIEFAFFLEVIVPTRQAAKPSDIVDWRVTVPARSFRLQ